MKRNGNSCPRIRRSISINMPWCASQTDGLPEFRGTRRISIVWINLEAKSEAMDNWLRMDRILIAVSVQYLEIPIGLLSLSN